MEDFTSNLKFSPCSIETDFLDKTSFVLLTVILQLTSVFFYLTFILQVPGDFAVISPSEVTEAILLLVLLYVGILPFEVNAAR